MKTIEQEAMELYKYEYKDNGSARVIKDAKKDAYIAGAKKHDPIAFGEWLVINYVNTINDKWRTMFSETTYTTAELFEIYLNREQEPVVNEEECNNDETDECQSCGIKYGQHAKGCPDDNSPYAEYLRNGFD